MSSAGHVLDSIAKMKFNRDQLMARRQRIADLKSMYTDSIKLEGYHFKEDRIPKEVVERVKTEIRDRIRRNRIRTRTFSILTTLIVIALIILLSVKYIDI